MASSIPSFSETARITRVRLGERPANSFGLSARNFPIEVAPTLNRPLFFLVPNLPVGPKKPVPLILISFSCASGGTFGSVAGIAAPLLADRILHDGATFRQGCRRHNYG